MEKAEKIILENMLHNKIIGEKHTDIIKLTKSFPKHARGEAKKAMQNLIKQKYIVLKPTNYGFQASINRDLTDEIKRILLE